MNRPLGSQYTIGEPIGRGGMGEVYRATDRSGRAYAAKLLRPDLADNPQVVAGFLQERSVLLGVRHPNVVGIVDLVAEGGTFGIVMDLVPGPDLRRTLGSAGSLPPAEVARLGAGVASGLAAVHAAGVVHRDVKPENVLLEQGALGVSPRVTDFGISRLFGPDAPAQTQVLMGTPPYLAPEVAHGEAASPACDLYALAVVLYELCCGVVPFAGDTATVLHAHTVLDPGRPQGVPDPLWDLIGWMLAKDPAERPESAAQVAASLSALAGLLPGVPAAPPLAHAPPGLPSARPFSPAEDGAAARSPWAPWLPQIVARAALPVASGAAGAVAGQVVPRLPSPPSSPTEITTAALKGSGRLTRKLVNASVAAAVAVGAAVLSWTLFDGSPADGVESPTPAAVVEEAPPQPLPQEIPDQLPPEVAPETSELPPAPLPPPAVVPPPVDAPPMVTPPQVDEEPFDADPEPVPVRCPDDPACLDHPPVEQCEPRGDCDPHTAVLPQEQCSERRRCDPPPPTTPCRGSLSCTPTAPQPPVSTECPGSPGCPDVDPCANGASGSGCPNVGPEQVDEEPVEPTKENDDPDPVQADEEPAEPTKEGDDADPAGPEIVS
ncbi:MAG: serine/threonine-protein kinase [Sporichthyaceae bacterium]